MGNLDDYDTNIILERAKNILIRNVRIALHDETWNIRSLHIDASKNVFNRLKETGWQMCRGVVQMPTGAGKSYCMALITTALYVMKRDYHAVKWSDRDIVLTLAPLNRIKRQLYNTFNSAAGGATSKHMVVVMMSHSGDLEINSKQLDIEDLWDLQERGSISRAMKHLLNRRDLTKDDKLLILLLYPSMNIFRDEDILSELKERLLAIFIDEAHYGYSKTHEDYSWFFVKNLIDNSIVALGFTATPTANSLRLFDMDSPLYIKHSFDLMKEAENILNMGGTPILVPHLETFFFRTIHQDNYLVSKRDEEYWRVCNPARVERYVDELNNIVRRVTNEYGLMDLKTLILAPNTKEADSWYDKLSKTVGGDVDIFIAHSKRSTPQSEIENFINSYPAILVAVDMVKLGFDDPNLDLLVIARPTRTEVGYVQLRGRVLRWPKDNNTFKAKQRRALLIHLASEREMEKEELIKRAEEGLCEIVSRDLKGGGEGISEEKIPVSILPISNKQWKRLFKDMEKRYKGIIYNMLRKVMVDQKQKTYKIYIYKGFRLEIGLYQMGRVLCIDLYDDNKYIEEFPIAVYNLKNIKKITSKIINLVAYRLWLRGFNKFFLIIIFWGLNTNMSLKK